MNNHPKAMILTILALPFFISACENEEALIADPIADKASIADLLDSLNVRLSYFGESTIMLPASCVYSGAKPTLPEEFKFGNFKNKSGFHFIGVEFERDASLHTLLPKPGARFDRELKSKSIYKNWHNRHMNEASNSSAYKRVLGRNHIIKGSSLDYQVVNKSRILFRLHNSALFFDVNHKNGPIELAAKQLPANSYAPLYTKKNEIEVDSNRKWISVPFYNKDGELKPPAAGKTCDYVYNLNVVSKHGSFSTQIVIDPVIFNDGGG